MEVLKEPFDKYYEVKEVIGSGQYAVVKKCQNLETGVDFAAKFIRKRRGGGRRGATIEDIMKEIEILRQMDDPNVISLFEVYETAREVILVLELVGGGELFDYVSSKDRLNEEDASAFIKQILLGVRHLHEKCIAHLDIKPENVLLLSRDRHEIKLIDFGISRILRAGEDIRAMLGTPEFVAPEVVNFEPLSLATDMWSIGVVTYILLSGASPFLGDNKEETYNNIATTDFTFDDEYFSNVSDMAKDFISSLLLNDPRERATVHDCLRHIWIEPIKKEQRLARRTSYVSVHKLKKFQARKHWKQSLKVVSLCNRLSRSVQLRKSCDGLMVNGDHDEDENFVLTALFCASEEGNLSGIQDLLSEVSNFDINQSNKHGETAIHMAASGGHVEVMEFLLTKSADINHTDKHGDSAVYWAARQGQVDMVTFLHINGADLDLRNKSGETALHVAARYGFTTVVEILLAGKANPNLEDNLGETGLHSCAWHGFVPIIHLLCSYGADLSIQNKEGESSLHCAAARGNLECVRVLLEFSAPLNLVDKNGSSSLHLACKRHQIPICLLLLHAGCDMDICDNDSQMALHSAAREGLLSVVQTMCALGCHVDQLSESGLTPLHVASRAGHTEIVRCLLLAGAVPDLKNSDGCTAEILAAAQGFREIVYLLSHVAADHQHILIHQLTSPKTPLSSIKLKVLGSMGVGKSTIIDSLKCSYFGSFFHRSRRRSKQQLQRTNSGDRSSVKMSRQFSLPNQISCPVDADYTHGIVVEHVDVPGLGEMSVWDFSGYDPYYLLYDHFLGDVNCIHLVLFSLADTGLEQTTQVNFWLNFIKARIPPHEPIGHMGVIPNRAKVILVATHADTAGCSKNSHGEYVSVDASMLHEDVARQYYPDLEVYHNVFVLDAQVAMGVELKALKAHLATMKTQVLKMMPPSSGLLDAVLAQLPSWRRSYASFPAMFWSKFTELVRNNVNPLAGEDHMRMLVQQLQLIGEVVYLDSVNTDDFVVLDPNWLCNRVIGDLLSQDKLMLTRVSGCYSTDEFQVMFHETDAASLLPLLEALDLCIRCENDGDIEYEFPALIFLESMRGWWENNNKLGDNPVYGGIRIQTSFTCDRHLKHVFPRIQVQLRRTMLEETEDNDNELCQWYHGSKFFCSNLEGMISMDRKAQFIELKVRGIEGMNTNAFYFLEDFASIVEQTLVDICPGMCIERHIMSVSQLESHGKTIETFSPQRVYKMQLDKKSELRLKDGTSDHFVDLACLGSDEVLNGLALGVDLHVSHLNLHTRRLLSLLLDPPDHLGRDWCLVAVSLNLPDILPTLDTCTNTTESKTDHILVEWSKNPANTIGGLVSKLQEMGRHDAAQVIMQTGPLFKVFVFDNQDDAAESDQITKASSNTLSNLSR